MAGAHEFGILGELNKQIDYINYEPKKYNCISVGDDIINSLNEHLFSMKTYFHTFNRPEFGLAYWGITIIPPESLSLLYDVITSSSCFDKSLELNELAAKIILAKAENKYMIHFGI